MTPIQKAIAAAEAKAAETAGPDTDGAATGTQVATNTPQRGGSAISLRDQVESSTTVDTYAKLKDVGINLGADPKFLCDEFLAKINLSDVVAFAGLRFGQGSSTTYKRSLDRQTESQTGRSWGDVVGEAQRIDPKCKGDYDAADVPMTLIDDVEGGKGKDPIKAGTVVGYTTSITGYKFFKAFAQQIYKAGLDDVDLKVRVFHEALESNGNTWGVLNFEFLGVYDENEGAAE
jgi:hypothetical protein